MDAKPTALITGGAQRLGRAIALMLAKQGYDMAIHYNSSHEAADQLINEVSEFDCRCQTWPIDFDAPHSTKGLVERVRRTFPGLCLLINNASIFESSSLEDTTEDLYDRHMAINLKAPFLLSRDFACVCQSGQIINILDTRVGRITTDFFAYTLSKQALYDLTIMSAKALAPKFRVNAIAPGLILPPEGQGQAYLDEKAQGVPLKAAGNEGKVLAAIEYLLANDFVTGQCLFVDGGEHLL